MDLNEIAGRIRQIRKSLGLLQEEFAQKLNVSVPTLSDVENGKTRPSFDILYNLFAAFNVNLDYIFLGEGEPFRRNKKGLEAFWEEKPFGQLTEDVIEMLWYMKNSKLVFVAIATYAKEYLYKNEDLIKKDIEKSNLSSAAQKEIPPSQTTGTDKEKKSTINQPIGLNRRKI